MKLVLKDLDVEFEVLHHLPIYFNYIKYNNLIDRELEDKFLFKSKKGGNISYSRPKKILSKIIDYRFIEITEILAK